MTRQPFQLFRVFISDGSRYDVRHPEMIMVGEREVVIGLETTEDDVFQRFAYCDPLHITRLEPQNGRRTVRRSRTKK